MGFDIRRFESSVDDELICSICEGVLENPIQVVSCEHVFCSDCLDQWIAKGKKSCPLDRKELSDDEMKAPRIVTNLLAKLNIRCDFANYGCNSVVKLENLSSHCTQCQYNPDKPFKCEKGCGLVLANRCELDKHNCMEQLHNLVRGQTEQIDTQNTMINELRTDLLTAKAANAQLEHQVNQIKQLVANFEFKLAVQRKASDKVMDCLSKIAKEVHNCEKQYKLMDDTDSGNNYAIRFKDNTIQVDPHMTIGQLKQTFMKSFNLRSGKLKLFNGSDELDDMKSLVEYGIEANTDRLSLVQCDDVQVFVKVRVMNSKDNVKHPYLYSDFLPKTVALRVDRNSTIGQMKAEIKLIHNMVCEDELLTYGTVTLQDQFDLTYYNITDGSFINYYAHL